MRIPALLVALVACGAFGVGCPAAQVKSGAPSANGVEVVLRRIDVVKAGFDKVELKIIVAVENNTGSDVDVSADANIALVGPAAADDENAPAEGEGETESEGVAGLDGKRHSGSGNGKALANTTSELPILVTLPLPEDLTVLEQVLSWPKARVHVAGKVRAGFTERTIGGEREITTPKLPKFKVKSAQVAKVDGGEAGEAFITLLLENTNTFEIVVDSVTWRILIADKELRTKEDGGTSIPPSSVEEYNISVPLDESAFPVKELRALLKKPSIPYRVDAGFEARGIKGSEIFSGDAQFP
jgi:hypothetical protein